MMRNIWAVVPIKSFIGAKKRLARVIDPKSRAALVNAMANDVIRALKHVRQLTGIRIVTASDEVHAFARAEGVDDWHDPLSGDLSGTLEAAAEHLAASRRADTMMIVPCDVPLVRHELLAEALDRHESLTLASDDQGEGTNLLIASPPNLIRLCYDGHGFRTHLARGHALGLTPQIIEDDSIHLDVDTAEDLQKLRSFEAHPRYGQAESVRISCTIQSAY
ncbi:MAG: 2-phospho-L-lactate guanylyltransferase [Gammaproteobacteria bacterium]|nr:2-phospho-L-lactate guanylyltransferase [Gammaproteobacteria bacterium]MCY4277764.1 2-phospho-L-lactate guanylyltransferase [Gammaproteobacteria bacterium]MCY4322216.1 2-phospho-L-lactate guanylyltransferase [Gammaproteobacteria bacterium]